MPSIALVKANVGSPSPPGHVERAVDDLIGRQAVSRRRVLVGVGRSQRAFIPVFVADRRDRIGAAGVRLKMLFLHRAAEGRGLLERGCSIFDIEHHGVRRQRNLVAIAVGRGDEIAEIQRQRVKLVVIELTIELEHDFTVNDFQREELGVVAV